MSYETIPPPFRAAVEPLLLHYTRVVVEVSPPVIVRHHLRGALVVSHVATPPLFSVVVEGTPPVVVSHELRRALGMLYVSTPPLVSVVVEGTPTVIVSHQLSGAASRCVDDTTSPPLSATVDPVLLHYMVS